MGKTVTSAKNPEYIHIKGARVHNLKNVEVQLPRNKLVVITGLSGSGKSSLAFDTLYAEGQRRYVESLSAYARQFLGKIEKPDVDFINGISPAIAIEQKVNTRNPRSTVGTTTEIYDYLKLLFARIGKTYSPASGREVKKDSPEDVLNFLNEYPTNTRVSLYSPFDLATGERGRDQIAVLMQQGFSRVKIDDELLRLEDVKFPTEGKIYLLIDRFAIAQEDNANNSRIFDSVETCFYEGHGECLVEIYPDDTKDPKVFSFTNRFESDGMLFEEPSVNLFSFNNPYGACRTCEGFGSVIGIDEDLVVPDKSLSVFQDAVVAWRGEKMSEWKDDLIRVASKFDFPVHRAYYELTADQKKQLWEGNKHFAGLNGFFKHLEEQSYKIQYRVMLSRFRGKTTCHECHGTRLRSDANYVKVDHKSISELVLIPVQDLLEFCKNISLNDQDRQVAKRLMTEITNRLQYLNDVGLGYLTLNRLSNTLSGGESQRINLAVSLGSSLVGSMYILDEPSIGLHPRDTRRLIGVLQNLKELGNTVIVVEHDEEIMRAADEIVDMGPEAGTLGGHVVFKGDHAELLRTGKSLTARYLSGELVINKPEKRRKWKKSIVIAGARENNLKGFSVKFPLGIMTAVTGVSGSGKTSLVKKILYPALRKLFGGYGEKTGSFDKLDGDFKAITGVEFIDQNPIGKSSRSNPVTYVKAYDEIRELYAQQPLAKNRSYKPSHFSFNVPGGRCEMCEGEGEVKIEMQFMADIHLLCETCKGQKFKDEVLEIEYRNKSIYDILTMTIDDAICFFREDATTNTARKVVEKLLPLQEVGLGYVQLGQSSSTLSGGEAQRIKLASFLGKSGNTSPLLFIFDEPTTGLHFHDINKLLKAFNALVERGHSLVIIEHNLDVIKCADWVIDLGPEGGEKGGELLFEGTPEDLANCKASHTGFFLKDKL